LRVVAGAKKSAVKRADDLLELPVRMRGIALGRAVDLLIDREGPRAIGFDVLCGDEAHRFLPFVVASFQDDGSRSIRRCCCSTSPRSTSTATRRQRCAS
jgi:hypothetical protein